MLLDPDHIDNWSPLHEQGCWPIRSDCSDSWIFPIWNRRTWEERSVEIHHKYLLSLGRLSLSRLLHTVLEVSAAESIANGLQAIASWPAADEQLDREMQSCCIRPEEREELKRIVMEWRSAIDKALDREMEVCRIRPEKREELKGFIKISGEDPQGSDLRMSSMSGPVAGYMATNFTIPAFEYQEGGWVKVDIKAADVEPEIPTWPMGFPVPEPLPTRPDPPKPAAKPPKISTRTRCYWCGVRLQCEEHPNQPPMSVK